MKTIGEIRQARLQQFISETGLSYADVNERLGRNRRDATLNQVAKAAKNTRTGKPRRMGDTQARLLETTFKMPEGWFDTDPINRPDSVVMAPDGTLTVIEAKRTSYRNETSGASAMEEPVATYGWPFETVTQAEVGAMPAERRAAMERVMVAFLGSATALPDWRSTALKLAADLDRTSKNDVFTMFVRGVEVEMQRYTPTIRPKERQ